MDLFFPAEPSPVIHETYGYLHMEEFVKGHTEKALTWGTFYSISTSKNQSEKTNDCFTNGVWNTCQIFTP